MKALAPSSVLIVAATFVATWDGWRWYAGRVWATPEEALSLGLTVGFLAFVGMAQRSQAGTGREMPLALLAAVLFAYAALRMASPPIFPAALAVSVTLFSLYVAFFKQRPPAAFWGLVALSLPVLPSLQFTLGYPLRIVSAALTVGLLQLQGLAIERQGTFLVWRGEMVQFDAPCSGVNMLWAGLLLTLMGGVFMRLGAIRLLAAITASVVLTIAANVLRAASLFYVETGLLAWTPPAWWHEGAGLAAFLMSSSALLWVLVRLQDQEATP
jgi:exosortase/archaeosortase family protein